MLRIARPRYTSARLLDAVEKHDVCMRLLPDLAIDHLTNQFEIRRILCTSSIVSKANEGSITPSHAFKAGTTCSAVQAKISASEKLILRASIYPFYYRWSKTQRTSLLRLLSAWAIQPCLQTKRFSTQKESAKVDHRKLAMAAHLSNPVFMPYCSSISNMNELFNRRQKSIPFLRWTVGIPYTRLANRIQTFVMALVA